MKRAEPSSSGGGGPAAEESLMTVVQDMSRQLEEKADRLNLRSSSVRRIIKEVLSDQDVVSMFREYLSCDKPPAAAYEPKLTRSQVKRICLDSAAAASSASAVEANADREDAALDDNDNDDNDDEDDDEEDDGDYVVAEDEEDDKDDEDEDEDEDDDVTVANKCGDKDLPATPVSAAADDDAVAASATYATRSRCPIPDFSWEKYEEAILKSDFYLGDFALDDVDLDADAVSASIQPSSQSQTQQQQPPPLLSTPPPSGAPLDDIGAVKAEDAAIFDEDDVEFRNFLRDIYLDRIEVADPPNEAEEDADFNVMAEPEEAYQEDFVEDLRYNRASRIPKREVRDLLDEICSDLFDSQLSAGRHLQQQAGASSPPQPLSQDDQEATAEPECLLQPCAVEDLSQEQRVELRKQLTMYVQLLCTMRITCHQQSPELADSAKVHLNELKLLADAYEAANPANTSILRVANLDGAVSLADNFAGLSDTDLLVCYSRPSRSLSSRSDCTADELAESTYLMPPQLCNLFLTSSVFPYAQLFPPGMSASVCRSKRTVFTPSEDRLLLLGLTQFGHRRDVFQLISKYTMPWRSQVAISARCVYLSKLQSLLFRDSLCPARVLTRSLIISCLRRRQHLLSAASQPQAGKSAAPSSPPPDPKQSEPDSIDLNFCQSNWINSVPILTDCVLDRPADWCHLPQLFRQHLLLERPRLRGQLLKPTEPNPLERDTANDQANKLFKRCRILFKDMRHERLLGVRLLWRDPQMAAVVPASLNPPPQSLPRRRRGPKRRRVSGHPMTIRQALLASGRRPHDRSPTRLLMPRISSVSGSQQPPAQLPSPPILDTASAECANQVKKKVKDYLLSRMRIKSGNFSSSDMPPQPPPQPPPPPPPPPAVMAKSCRLILPKPPSVQASTADTCQIASDLILSELRSRRRDQQVQQQQQQQQQDMPAVVLALQSSQASSASSSLLSFLSGLQATNCMETSISPPAGCNADLPTDDAIAMAAPAAATDDYQIQSPLPPPPASIAAAELSVDTNQPPATQPKMELDDDAVIDDKDAVDLSPETIPTLSCLPYLSEFLQSNTFRELRRGRWKPGRSGRLDQENLDQLVTDDLCESGGADDDRDIEFASAFLRCLRTELSSTPEAYWEALQTIGRLAETPDLDQVSFYRSALSALPAHAGCSRSMLAGFVSVETALLVDALPDHLSVWRNRCLVRKIHRQLREQRCKSPIVLHRFEKSLARWMSTASSIPDDNRLARLIDDLDTTFKYFPYCLSETLSQFPEVPNFAESRDAFEYVDLTSSQPSAATTASAAPSTEDFARRPRDSVFECLPESLGLHEDRSLSCSCACHVTTPTNLAEAQKSKESGSSAATIPGERRVLRHCDNCALVSRHHMLLVEKLESRRLRHYDYACVHFPPEFRPRSDLPPAPQVDAEVVVPAYRPASSIQQRRQQPTGGVGSGSSGGGGGASGRDNTGSGGGVGGGCGGQPRHRQQHRTAESAALLEETFAVTIRAAALYADAEEDNDEISAAGASSSVDAGAANAVVEVESSTTTRCGPASAMTPHEYELAERRRPLFEPSASRRRLADRAWTEAEDRAILQHCQANGFSSGAFRCLSERLLDNRTVESVRQRFRLLMRSYLAAQGAEYSTSDMDELSDCDE
ncbi:hypothetical protein BOX15_Mlig022176g1 [Macrostomum lignano]|uniref:Myb-like domain-containing protein n=1 Tax=Macrostomum lignano TaxID=282301 RepID=A0A267FG57_9PLAT|nr:hypothetical protein BOX15_Mlig022176g1 [Macrostomum lignano]